MKNIVIAAAGALALLVAGCNKIPTVERMTTISKAVGKTAAVAVELSKTKQAVKDGITQVLNVVSNTVPGVNETFVAKWTPLIDAETQKLVDAGKLDAASATLVKGALYVACDGIDLIFVRYPKAKEYQELVSAAVTGFCDGFNSVMTPTFSAKPGELDTEALEYLKGKIKARQAK